MDAERLVAQARVGDLRQILQQESDHLWRLLIGVSGGREDLAREAAAEAFARALANDQPILSPPAWLYRTALRVLLRELARESRETSGGQLPELAITPGMSDDLLDLLAGLRQLSPRQRAAVVLFYLDDLPVSQIADLMGISAPTVRVHLHTGRRALRSALESGPDQSERSKE